MEAYLCAVWGEVFTGCHMSLGMWHHIWYDVQGQVYILCFQVQERDHPGLPRAVDPGGRAGQLSVRGRARLHLRLGLSPRSRRLRLLDPLAWIAA